MNRNLLVVYCVSVGRKSEYECVTLTQNYSKSFIHYKRLESEEKMWMKRFCGLYDMIAIGCNT